MRKRRVVAITGGTRGIGAAIRDIFVDRDYSVAICSREIPETLSEDVLHCAVDVQNKDEVSDFVESVVDHFGTLDVFINNAGISRWKAIEEVDKAFVDEIIHTNLEGTLWGCRAAAAAMGDGGSIINISSLAGKRGSANNSVYCAAKFAVNGITQSLAKELGSRNIRVNAVCPVYVETERILSVLEEENAPPQGLPVAKYIAEFTRTQTALGRLPTVMEVAEVVFFLAGDRASAITGQCLNVDCGTLPQ